MIDRNVRFRLLLVLEIMRQSSDKMSVQDIYGEGLAIEEIKEMIEEMIAE